MALISFSNLLSVSACNRKIISNVIIIAPKESYRNDDINISPTNGSKNPVLPDLPGDLDCLWLYIPGLCFALGIIEQCVRKESPDPKSSHIQQIKRNHILQKDLSSIHMNENEDGFRFYTRMFNEVVSIASGINRKVNKKHEPCSSYWSFTLQSPSSGNTLCVFVLRTTGKVVHIAEKAVDVVESSRITREVLQFHSQTLKPGGGYSEWKTPRSCDLR